MCAKMSQLHAELTEQASELGFETIQDAVNSGYVVDYERGKLVKYGLGYSETVEYLMKEQEKAHEAWLKERDEVVAGLQDCYKHLHGFPPEIYSKLLDAIRFIKEQCHD